jgi:hypothetical protein
MKNTKNITSDLTLKFHKYMVKTFDFTLVSKANSFEMELIAKLIEQIAPIAPEIFLAKYATTIRDYVYIPYEVGKGTKKELFRQIKTITHEAQHVVDFRDNPIKMLSYVLLESSRAQTEARAMTATVYLQWWYSRKMPNLSEMIKNLAYYGISAKDQQIAYKHLRMHTPIAKRGVVPNNLVVKKAVTWLKKNCK